MMVSIDLEISPYEIWVLGFQCMKDSHHFILICEFSQIVIKQLFIGECQGASLLHQDYFETFA
jgi:hypothetical protein